MGSLLEKVLLYKDEKDVYLKLCYYERPLMSTRCRIQKQDSDIYGRVRAGRDAACACGRRDSLYGGI